jgi:AcrR family transcriptional regulator
VAEVKGVNAGKRRYDNSRRREHAEGTQGRILHAAHTLLLERGYAATTMADIAAAAGVAVQTVYNAVGGGKATLAKRVWDITVAGDLDPVALEARPVIQALFNDPVPSRKLNRYATLCRELYERLGPLARVLRAGAAAGDSELDQLLDTVERERFVGTASIAAHLAAIGALRRELTVERAGHRLFVISAAETGDALVLRLGWSLDEYEAWMTEMMIAALLQPPDQRRPT